MDGADLPRCEQAVGLCGGLGYETGRIIEITCDAANASIMFAQPFDTCRGCVRKLLSIHHISVLSA